MQTGSLLAAVVTEVWAAAATLGEGPTWDQRTGRVYWVDIKGLELHAFRHGDGERRTWPLPFRLCSLAPAAPPWSPPHEMTGDAFVACGDPGLMWLSLDGASLATQPIVHPERGSPANRFNDGKLGPDGRYWAGTMDDNERETTGSLYAFAADGTFEVMDQGYRVTNGPAFSPDGRTVYHTDSARQEIYAFALGADGRLGPRRLLRRFDPGEGYPDGMTTDGNGDLWVAMWDGWRIQRLSPEGHDIGAVPIPAARCTSCVFASPDVLYVTSAAIGLEGQAGAGSLYRVDLT